jgi:hypothetical protein
MTTTALSTRDLVELVRSVFHPREDDHALAVMVDLPDEALPDHPGWAARREMAVGWVERLREGLGELGLEQANLVAYRNVRRNNADLPAEALLVAEESPPDGAVGVTRPFEQILSEHSILLCPTELSATAPLKLLAKKLGFRAATMGGFSPAMLPALRLDWEEIDGRCRALKDKLDDASAAHLRFVADGRTHELVLDLRHRHATASGGLLREPGRAGNLPSGESYIVPYEGERADEPSQTTGSLPIEMEGELLVYQVQGNRVRAVEGEGSVAERERREMENEPAYANVAELGLGLLAGYGIEPVGTILLDEKLGLHIAFGRSDHFGGTVGVADFSSPDRVVHIDRVYIPAVQPRVQVASVDLELSDGSREPLMRDGKYV